MADLNQALLALLTGPANDISVTAAPARQAMPEHVKRHLEATGYMDAETGATRKARYSRCKNCRQAVIIGLDGDMCAMPRELDPRPLTAASEALAKMLRLQTFNLRQFGAAFQISVREQFGIAGKPPGTPGIDVLIQHTCKPAQQFARMRSDFDLRNPNIIRYPDEPPF